ncbi:MAG: sodium:solute symporter family protein, partial [Thermoguttaceae bacterium]
LSHGTSLVIAVYMICVYLLLLVTVALLGSIGHKRNSAVDYFLASRACGAFLLVMTIFGTTMTSFALVGSTGQAFKRGIGVYGQMASWSGLIHSACFFIIGTKLWYYGKRFGYSTQIQFFRDRFQSNALGFLLFPILVSLVVPYVVLNILGSGATIQSVTAGAFPSIFAATGGGIPAWLGSAMVCLTVLTYVFGGGMRSLSFANALHASVLILLGGVILFLVLDKLGGAAAASALVAQQKPGLLVRGGAGLPGPSQLEFMSYMFVPLSVGMFPHLFQHWMTAKDVKTFRPVVILHPIFIMLVWAPCILLGIWASTAVMPDGRPVVDLLSLRSPNEVLGIVVNKLTNPVVAGFLGVGIVSATMSLDSQFLALSSMFTHDILLRIFGEQRIRDKQRIILGRSMVVAIVVVAYVVSLFSGSVYTLGVWCFTGFAGLFPLVFAALYWKRVTSTGAIASIVATAASWLYLFADSNWGKTEKLFLGMMPAASIVFVSAVTLVVVSLVTKPPAKEVIERFFPEEAVI